MAKMFHSKGGRDALLLMIVVVAITLASNPSAANAQHKNSRLNSKQALVASVNKRPELGVELKSVARLKIASRKEIFHLGEMINIDIAMLNRSQQRLFFYSIKRPNFSVHDEAGEKARITPYLISDVGLSPALYKLTEPNDFITESFGLLAGCDKRAFEQVNSVDVDDSSLAAFDKDLYLNWGSACLQVTRPGNYFVSVEFINDYVVTQTGQSKAKTAVGKITSNILKITVVE